MNAHPRTTRLAPSPTGALHLGNARTFLVNYLLARRCGWRIVLRMEDLDGPRVKAGAADEALEDLRWLGLQWDERTTDQSQRAQIYDAAVRRLMDAALAYPCTCSRGDVLRAASAPHLEDGVVVYPGLCRGRWNNERDALDRGGRAPAIRLRVNDEAVEFIDAVAGPQRFELTAIGGDFVIRKADGTAAYQLAVVVDDADGAITDVVRGDDLLDSTARQLFLWKLLTTAEPPRYWHLPLVVGPDGRRLAKRHGDTRLAHYRGQGVGVERVLGLLGYWCGVVPTRRPLAMADLLAGFDMARVPAGQIVFAPADEAFLLGR